MQDEINEKVVALSIKGGKLTAATLQKAVKAMLAQMKKQHEKQPQGKQTLKQLAKQNAGLSNIEITEGNIKAFEHTAKKYGIDFALKKDATAQPSLKSSLKAALSSAKASSYFLPKTELTLSVCCRIALPLRALRLNGKTP